MKIIMVDDEEDIRKIGKLSLQAVGRFDTRLAASAEEGIRLALADPPDVILLDVMMPGTDGLGALVQIQATPELAHVPVVFMTARVQASDREDYLRRGARGIIQKPFDPMTLPAEILRILGEAR